MPRTRIASEWMATTKRVFTCSPFRQRSTLCRWTSLEKKKIHYKLILAQVLRTRKSSVRTWFLIGVKIAILRATFHAISFNAYNSVWVLRMSFVIRKGLNYNNLTFCIDRFTTFFPRSVFVRFIREFVVKFFFLWPPTAEKLITDRKT